MQLLWCFDSHALWGAAYGTHVKSMFSVNIRGILGDQRQNRIGHKGSEGCEKPSKKKFSHIYCISYIAIIHRVYAFVNQYDPTFVLKCNIFFWSVPDISFDCIVVVNCLLFSPIDFLANNIQERMRLVDESVSMEKNSSRAEKNNEFTYKWKSA